MTTPHTLTKPERPYVDWSFFIGGSVPIVLICLAWFSLGIPSWLVIPALCIGCGAAAWGVYLWFLISEFHSRLVSEHEKAKGNRYDEQTQRQLAQKHYRKLLKRADEIKTEHDERFADDRWIAYLKSRLSGEAGQYVLDYYHQEMALLHKAQNVHSEISPEAMSINKTKHKARKEAARHFAQLDIDKESEKRLKEKKSRSKYWDD